MIAIPPRRTGKDTNPCVLVWHDDGYLVQPVRDFVSKPELDGLQCHVPGSLDSTACGDDGVRGFPAAFLIDPEGNVLATNRSAEDLGRKL